MRLTPEQLNDSYGYVINRLSQPLRFRLPTQLTVGQQPCRKMLPCSTTYTASEGVSADQTQSCTVFTHARFLSVQNLLLR